MERLFVSSSNLYSVGYNSDAAVLEIEFRNGGLYQYYHVPAHVYHGLMQADSHGRYFIRFIQNRFRYRRIR